MKAATPTRIDFSELTRLISREIDGALRLSSLSKDWRQKLHIASVRIRLGRISPPSPETRGAISDVQGSAGDPARPFLMLEHYPPAQQGWEYEMEFSAGPSPPKVRRMDGIWHVVPPEPLPTADLLFRDMPLRAIKGVHRAWEQRFGRLGISTIAELMSLKHRDLVGISEQTNSKYPLELFAKTQLLRVAVPEIPQSAADDAPLSKLIEKSPADLRKLIGHQRISATAGEQLYALLSMLHIAIDDRILRQILLEDLRGLSET
jgi:hypothetical protein